LRKKNRNEKTEIKGTVTEKMKARVKMTITNAMW